MNSSPKRASDRPASSRRNERNFDLFTARKMLPYVRSIVTDVVQNTARLNELTPVQKALDEARRSLEWRSRKQRYAVSDEIRTAEENIAKAESELDAIGVHLADRSTGRVDFPSRINGRPAAYSWQLGEDAVGFWHYDGESLRRTIPAEWQEAAAKQPEVDDDFDIPF